MSFNKVSIHSVPAMRVEADEHLGDVFETLGYTESFKYSDTKLILGYSSVALAGLMYYLEKKFKNDFTDRTYVSYLQLAVVSFFIVQFVLYCFTKFVEKGVKYHGTKKNKSISVFTSTKSKFDPNYNITLKLDGNTHKTTIPLNELFFDDGFLSIDAFKSKITGFVESFDKSK
ncbi:hypothetical protein DAPK24_031270 [Pichia kluyveri]|uniref:Signal peptidase complex subunit 2 n=1 Tax=Pichia kluyveri TaxID=36015 RepID=A0AAV5R6C6_PICKL|nr:hypothetical protein DAPK24_031270 [Pichia kluyveri]